MTGSSPLSRTRSLFSARGIEARLSYYAPGRHMAAHSHDETQFSVLLAGSLQEITAHGEADVFRPSAGIKRAGLRHANDYGPDGALILSVNTSAEHQPGWGWSARESGDGLFALARLIARGGETAGDAAAELIDLFEGPHAAGRQAGRAPDWLKQVRGRIQEEPAAGLDALAAGAGVHRVHLSRRFAAVYGEPVSVFRRRVLTARAVRAILDERAAPGLAAAEAGFADQAHFTRVLGAQAGLTPGRLSLLFTA